MALGDPEIGKLNNVRSKVSSVDNLNNIKDFVNDSLLTVFTDPNFFSDNRVRDRLNITVESIEDCAKSAYDKIIRLVADYNAGNAYVKATKEAEINKIQDTITDKIVDFSASPATVGGTRWGFMTTEFKRKYESYKKMATKANRLKYQPNTIPPVNLALWELGSDIPVDLKNHFIGNLPDNMKCYMVSDDWKEIKPVWWKYKIKMKLTDGTETDVNVSWIEFNGGEMKLKHNMSFDPSNIDMSQPMEFSVAGSFDNINNTWINLFNIKKVKINLSYGSLDAAWRWAQFNAYNNSLNPKPIKRALDVTFTDEIWGKRYNHKVEREALEAVLTWDPLSRERYDTLSPEQKEKFFQRMFRGGWKSKEWTLGLDSNTPNFEEFYTAWRIRECDAYKAWFISDDRARNKDPDVIRSQARYLNYIRNKATSQDTCREFVKDALQKQMTAKSKIIYARFTEFLNEAEENKIDNDLNEYIDKKFFRKKRRALKMDKWPRSPFHQRDVNYMRFFNGSNTSITGQKVDIYTNEWLREQGDSEFKYDLDMNITSENKIDLTIKINGQEPINLSAWEPWALARRILDTNDIGPWKARVHICYNIYKALIKIAKEKNISLKYREGKQLREINLEGENIVITEKNEVWYKADKKKVFNEETFLWINNFERYWRTRKGKREKADEWDIWVLSRWIEYLGTQFNKSMNVLHRKYRRWTERKILKILHSPSRPKLPTSFWLSPVKKILNCKTETNFDFNETINAGGKSISVDFKKNKFTVDMEWLDKPISSRDLWKILNHRNKNWKRAFDGIEREFIEWVYKQLIGKLRDNAKVARTNFGVIDSQTWNLYVLDKEWKFGYVAKWDLKSYFGHPMRWLAPHIKKAWSLKDKNLYYSKIKYTKIDPGSSQEKEILENPFLMQRLLRAMNRRMWLKESIRSIFVS